MRENLKNLSTRALTSLFGFLFIFLHNSMVQASEIQPVLKERIEIYSDIVTLGDLFDFAGNSRNIPVFRAPDLGKTGIISAKRLALAAEKHGLNWPNPGAVNKIEVNRPSRKYSIEDIAELVRIALADRHQFADPRSLKVTLSHKTKPVHLEPRHKSNLIVKKLDYYSSSGNFRAIVGADERTRFSTDHEVRGVAKQMISVAVPVRPIARHSLIRSSDIHLKQIPIGNRINQLALDKNELIGKVARHRLAAQQPVRLQDVEQRKVIRKNTLVEIIYESGGLRLKSEGRALSDASEGELVTVMNTFSKRSIEGIAIGPGQVSVYLEKRITGGLDTRSFRRTGQRFYKQASNYR